MNVILWRGTPGVGNWTVDSFVLLETKNRD